MDYYFQTEEMTVGYDKKPLLRPISIGLKKGEILTLIGPNGAGKSTILKSIGRQLSLISGTIYIGKHDLMGMGENALAKKMAVLLTEKLMTELMTCEDVVATGRYPYTGRFGILSDKDKKIIDEAMRLIHVEEIRDQDFTKVSDGQRQRVMLARAICQEPEIILLDEPTSFLDVRYKLEFLSLLQEMTREKGLTVILSLHELELAGRISDKILCVDGQYADRFGTPEEIFTDGYISKLFSIDNGSFCEHTGTMELSRPQGESKGFVIAGGGCASLVFRKLQRKGIAFSTGILYENDLDYPTASALAAKVIHAKPFEPVDDTLVRQAKQEIDRSEWVVCCKDCFGSYEKFNEELREYAEKAGKLTWQK